jgi:hypothetical protein
MGMAGALFFISLFLITIVGGLLLRPEPLHSIQDFRKPEALQERKQVTLRMAEFLKRNPKIVEQKVLTTLPLEDSRNIAPGEAPPPLPPPRPQETFAIRFQGADLRFQSIGEYDAWLHKTLKSGGDILTQADLGSDPDLLLSTLKKCIEIEPNPEMKMKVKGVLLEKAGAWLGGQDGASKQWAQKALEQYLELEEDRALGKKTVDALLETVPQ